jgi:hypothetical protein
MNLISCENCGVVLDTNNLKLDKDWDTLEGKYCFDEHYKIQAVINCPVCNAKIQYNNGEVA